jgi:hypothetical protein
LGRVCRVVGVESSGRGRRLVGKNKRRILIRRLFFEGCGSVDFDQSLLWLLAAA